MSGRELDQHVLAPNDVDPEALRAAAVHVADRIGLEHPHELDDVMPSLAGRLLAGEPVIAAGLLELLEAIGLPTVPSLEQIGKRIHFAACFYQVVYRARIAELEHTVRTARSVDRTGLEAS